MEDENNFNINEISHELETPSTEEKYQYSEEAHDYEKNILDVKIIVKDLNAAEILIGIIENKIQEPVVKTLSTKLIVRGST